MRGRRETAEKLSRTARLRRRLGAILAACALVLWVTAAFLPARERSVAIILGGAAATGAIALLTTSV